MFPELISIGDNTSIGDKSIITVHANIPSNTLLRQVYPRETNPVKIGKNVWMMPHVIIIPGITIGDYSVIATGAVVVKDIPPMTLVVGVPAKPVKDLSDKIRKYIPKIEYEELLKKRKKFFGELFPKKSNVHN
jgi:acetyltransferase-like isoleucine patch superfamily enzyme